MQGRVDNPLVESRLHVIYLEDSILLEDVHVFGNGGRRQTEHLYDLAQAELAILDAQQGADARLVAEGFGDGEDVVHDTGSVTSSCNEVYIAPCSEARGD